MLCEIKPMTTYERLKARKETSKTEEFCPGKLMRWKWRYQLLQGPPFVSLQAKYKVLGIDKAMRAEIWAVTEPRDMVPLFQEVHTSGLDVGR